MGFLGVREMRRRFSVTLMLVLFRHDGARPRRALTDRLKARCRKPPFRPRRRTTGETRGYPSCLYLRGLPFAFTFSVGEPARNKHYRQAISPKRADDVSDSYACGRFAIAERPNATFEVPEAFQVLREIASRLESQARQTTRASNALHNLMSRGFPELATLVSSFKAEYLLDLLAKYPTPEKMARARRESLLAIRYIKDEKVEEIQAAAKQSVGSVRGELAEQLVHGQVEQIRQSRQAEKRLEKLLLAAYHALPESPHRQVEERGKSENARKRDEPSPSFGTKVAYIWSRDPNGIDLETSQMSKVAITHHDQVERAIPAALDYLDLEGVLRGKLVAVKPNDTWASRDDITGVTPKFTILPR
jgi:hypothetical protein